MQESRPGDRWGRVDRAAIESRVDIASAKNADVADLMVIATTQERLHYYIAAYGTLAATAKHLGMGELAATMADMSAHPKSKDADYSAPAEEMLANQADLAG